MPTGAVYNPDQSAAILAITSWLDGEEQDYFVLSGPAGTGKTFTVQGLLPLVSGKVVFTAPTNKATKVLRDTLRSEDYPNPDCRTIYSLLGLQLRANGEIKELAEPEDEVDLSSYRLVIVDEASMVNANLMRFIERAVANTGIKVLFMGDPFQLPPVKEDNSPVWKLSCPRAELREVMRQRNKILDLVTDIRAKMGHPAPRWNFSDAHDGAEGVFRPVPSAFMKAVDLAATNGEFQRANGAKLIAWRNVTVDKMNAHIRGILWGKEADTWVQGDRLTLLEPASDLDGKKQASTDDEGSVDSATVAYHPVFGQFKCWSLKVTLDDNKIAHLWAIHADSLRDFELEKESRAVEARANPRLWPKFWELCEAFHSVRHAYAITAHRAQGSTYESAFVYMTDILLNRNVSEARRCLYVACSRPRKRLYLA